jgi:hypothetical protein
MVVRTNDGQAVRFVCRIAADLGVFDASHAARYSRMPAFGGMHHTAQDAELRGQRHRQLFQGRLCSYERLAQRYKTGLNKVDLESSVLISANDINPAISLPLKRWEATFRQAAGNKTAIEIRAMHGGLGGSDYWVDNVLPDIKACEQSRS